MNLVIGNTSQQSYFYPDDYIKISSRNIDYDLIETGKFNSVYITFAEQRIYDNNIDYMSINYKLTLELLEKLINKSNKIVIFGTCELWNQLSSQIDITSDFNYKPHPYTESKESLILKINQLRQLDNTWNKVKIIHPFYFNSTRRSDYFLFGKVFDSILNKKKIEVGDLDFKRDMVHAKFFVEKTIQANTDLLIGAGQLFNVKQFIYDIYLELGLKPEDYIKQVDFKKANSKLIIPKVDWNYNYQDLIQDTLQDIKSRL